MRLRKLLGIQGHTPRLILLSGVAMVGAAAFLPTTVRDYRQPGSQPGDLIQPIQKSTVCAGCHGNFHPDTEPYTRWSGSMMAQSMRDPVFHAAFAVARQDATGAGELCLRCHTPGGFLEGRAFPTDGSALLPTDYDGVNCHVCHRMVDPFPDPANPPEDTGILAALGQPPTDAHNGQLVVDPQDRRRGPYDLGLGFPWHQWAQSPFHRESLLCATCHEVSNPAFTRRGGPVPRATDSYPPNALDVPHPTHSKYDEFPLERTYSEWALSDFGAGPVDMGGRFGGNKTLVSSCQDCHLPDTTGSACSLGGATRTDLPQHDFSGANSWVPLAVHSLDQSLRLYKASAASGVPLGVFQDAVARNISLLQRASDLDVTQDRSQLTTRITNQSGHKLPTGYPEGRRMWIHVRFLDGLDQVVGEHGAYDPVLAQLDTMSTKVYEVELGLDHDVSRRTGLPAGPSFHFVLNNKVYKDNRIPPRGFTNAGFEAVQALPVGAAYADGQHWDDTAFAIPKAAVHAEVEVLHQTTTREYIEFLRDENRTDSTGQIAYDEWVAHGKSSPVTMQAAAMDLAPRLDASPDQVQAGNLLTFQTEGGVPGHLSLFAIVGINSLPANVPVRFVAFDVNGAWTFSGVVPAIAGLPGNRLEFAAFVVGPAGNILLSTRDEVEFL